jgi:hypothetical protein
MQDWPRNWSDWKWGIPQNSHFFNGKMIIKHWILTTNPNGETWWTQPQQVSISINKLKSGPPKNLSVCLSTGLESHFQVGAPHISHSMMGPDGTSRASDSVELAFSSAMVVAEWTMVYGRYHLVMTNIAMENHHQQKTMANCDSHNQRVITINHH